MSGAVAAARVVARDSPRILGRGAALRRSVVFYSGTICASSSTVAPAERNIGAHVRGSGMRLGVAATDGAFRGERARVLRIDEGNAILATYPARSSAAGWPFQGSACVGRLEPREGRAALTPQATAPRGRRSRHAAGARGTRARSIEGKRCATFRCGDAWHVTAAVARRGWRLLAGRPRERCRAHRGWPPRHRRDVGEDVSSRRYALRRRELSTMSRRFFFFFLTTDDVRCDARDKCFSILVVHKDVATGNSTSHRVVESTRVIEARLPRHRLKMQPESLCVKYHRPSSPPSSASFLRPPSQFPFSFIAAWFDCGALVLARGPLLPPSIYRRPVGSQDRRGATASAGSAPRPPPRRR